MKTLSLPRQAAVTLLLPALLLVSACNGRVTAVQTFPPNADLQAVTEPKPKPTPDIVTDPQANERYNAAVEGWGDRVLDAGQRICTWAVDMGAKLPFQCRRDEN
jgi:hypothetical protein